MTGGSGERLAWWKSSLSETGACVEVARTSSGVAVRDTKDRSGPVLHFTVAEWQAFLGGVRQSEFELDVLQRRVS